MQDWRWIDDVNDTHTLLEGPGLMPIPRVILVCGNIDAADQDRIAAIPDLMAACEATVAKYRELYEGMDTEYAAFFTAMGKEVGQIEAALAKARGGRDDA